MALVAAAAWAHRSESAGVFEVATSCSVGSVAAKLDL